MNHPTDRITHTTAFVTPVVEPWLEREIHSHIGNTTTTTTTTTTNRRRRKRKRGFIYHILFTVILRTTQIAREETRCRHMGYSFRLAGSVLLYASSHRQDITYHHLCYTCRGALARTRNSSMGLPYRIDPTTHHTISEPLPKYNCNPHLYQNTTITLTFTKIQL